MFKNKEEKAQAALQSLRNMRLADAEPDQFAKELMDRVVSGEITTEEARKILDEKYKGE